MIECSLCGSTFGVEAQLVEYAPPYPLRRFDTIPRCLDRPACRARVEAAGHRWGLLDGTPETRPPVPQPSSPPDPERWHNDGDQHTGPDCGHPSHFEEMGTW